MYLYEADGTTQIADCGKITEVNTDKLNDITTQTYTLLCESSQLASYVKLEDSEQVQGEDLTMNIAEVTVYDTVPRPPNTGRSENTSDIGHWYSYTNLTCNCILCYI